MEPVIHRESINRAWAEFKAFLKKGRGRVTPARRIVFEKALSRGGHFSADELARELGRGAERVSRGTVYRTLALLNEAGYVRKLQGGASHDHFEQVLLGAGHEHLICEACGAFIEFDAPGLARLLARACRQRGFRARTRQVNVYGRCQACTKAAAPAKRTALGKDDSEPCPLTLHSPTTDEIP